ncbi:hypothetical protein D3C71_1647070 [compost metagenome]
MFFEKNSFCAFAAAITEEKSSTLNIIALDDVALIQNSVKPFPECNDDPTRFSTLSDCLSRKELGSKKSRRNEILISFHLYPQKSIKYVYINALRTIFFFKFGRAGKVLARMI